MKWETYETKAEAKRRKKEIEYKNGKPTVNYIKELSNGTTRTEQKTLTEKIRHQIHHPENCHNTPYTETEIRQSIEDMRAFIMNKRV